MVRGEAEDAADLRSSLVRFLGPEATAHAAATVSAFSGLVRVADATGIPIDGGLATASADAREELGLGAYTGAANSDLTGVQPGRFDSIDALFDNRAEPNQ